jgi:hypothetical protein
MSHFVSLESRLRLHAAWWVPFVGILMCPCEGKAQDQWTAMSIVDVPVARWRHTAVWTGSRMIVWGGHNALVGALNSGGVYDPTTDAWTPTTLVFAPPHRQSHTAVWTGSRMIVWGGLGGVWDVLYTGRLYYPGLPPFAAGPAAFFSVTPCRVADTRDRNPAPNGGPGLRAGAIRSFAVAGLCGVPPTATSVSVNVTAVQPTAPGYLTLYPGDAAGLPSASTVNFGTGVTRANNAVVPLSAEGGTINVKNGSAGAVHFVLDVNGYFQ